MDKVNFWNDRASKENPGSDDFLLKHIEQLYIINHIPQKAKVLDIGCGDGTTLLKIAEEKEIEGVGMDFASSMIKKAKNNNLGHFNIKFIEGSVLHLPTQQNIGLFDVIYTQRCLINLNSFQEQAEAIKKISNLLKDGGIYIMVESTHDGLDRINELRLCLNLEAISPPWHNTFFRIREVEELQKANFKIVSFSHLSSTYNFLSRCIYAKLAQQRNEKLKYDSEINRLSLLLPQEIGDFGPVKGWIWKKEG